MVYKVQAYKITNYNVHQEVSNACKNLSPTSFSQFVPPDYLREKIL